MKNEITVKPKIALLGGGTISYVRNHLALCAPAYGETVKTLESIFKIKIHQDKKDVAVVSYLTKMAGGDVLETNEDISNFVVELIAEPSIKVIVFNAALVDFDGIIGSTLSGKHAERLKTIEGEQVMRLRPTEKIIGRIRKERKDIFVVGFKTTTGATSEEQYLKGLELLKTNSLNLVVANDTVTRNNMIITPEESRYDEGKLRYPMLNTLADMILSRMECTFTRSTVIAGVPVEWKSNEIPDNLRQVVDYCVANGAYKPFLGKTVGHFAVKVNDKEILTSIRKMNFNELERHGLVRVEYDGKDKVIAHGAKPSVGGMSQRIIFNEHSEADCIIHFHCPTKSDIHHITWSERVPDNHVMKDDEVSIKPQSLYECGSHQCGQNTSNGLAIVDLGDGHQLKAVYLDNHGPNIVFSKDTPAEKVIRYIDSTYDLSQKTGGLV